MYLVFIDPSLVELFGYSSRNQKDKDAYINIKHTRLKAKKGLLTEDFLKPLGVTNEDLNGGLKLPINAYTGALRATFSKLFDPLQGFSICTTGQLLILQLIHDLQLIPTLEMVSANTDAVMYTIEEEYKEQALDVLKAWEKHTGLELEEDKIVKICMRDVNNYCEIVETKNGYKVNYKGGEFRGIHNFKWNKETNMFDYSFEDDIEANSLTIISEALLKNLLFDIPLEDTINKCNDIFRFQMITHLGSTYEKVVQESEKGDIVLQRNNRIYAGKKPSGIIVKVKYDGRRDSLANCPPNPIVDNANECTIDNINKDWYIKYAEQKLADFKGIKRMEEYKLTELKEMAINMGINLPNKILKADLIKLIKERNEEEKMATKKIETVDTTAMNIYQKLNEIKKEIRNYDFVMDSVMPANLGSKEYASIGQYYKILHNLCEKYNVLFMWHVLEVESFERDLFKPVNKMPSHVATVECSATFVNCDNPDDKVRYDVMASGSDICDKAVSGASTLAFRNFFDKNFTPKYMNTIDEEITEQMEEKTEAPKTPTYIPEAKKEELKKEVVTTIQQEESDKDDIKEIVDNIMKVRELVGNDEWGANTLDSLIKGELSSADILEIGLKVDNKLESLGGK